MSIFPLYPGLKLSLEHNSVRKNLFLSACFCWDSRIFSTWDGPKIWIWWNNWLCELLLGFFFRHFEVFRLHAILHDSAGAVRAHSGKGPGYCYMIGRGPNSSLLGHVTGLLICPYVKIFLPSIFTSVDFWNSMSLIVLDIELTEKDIFIDLVLYIDGSLQGFSFCPPKTINLISRRHVTQVNYMELRGVVESWIMISSLLSFTT